MNRPSVWKFLWCGILAAAGVAGCLVIVQVFQSPPKSVSGVGAWPTPFGDAVVDPVNGLKFVSGVGVWSTWLAHLVLLGPPLRFMTLFDVTDRQLEQFATLIAIPYWLGLGALTGWLLWWRWRRSTEQSRAGLTSASVMARRVCSAAVLIALLDFITRQHRASESKGPSIVGNLHRIDGAKQQLALEFRLGPEYVPTEVELGPYMSRRGRFDDLPRVFNERYVINAIGEAPYAVLDHDYRIRRRGFRQGYTIPKQVYRLESVARLDRRGL